MSKQEFYSLPALPYGYKNLEPYMSEAQLQIHHDKHHNTYVQGANGLLEKIDKARVDKKEYDVKAAAKELSWNIGGYILHSLFWKNLAPAGKGGEPNGKLKEEIVRQFESFDSFKDEFNKTAIGVEGSGWAALAYCPETERLLLMQIEKHNVNIYPTYQIILILDMFEHAYYIDYKNEKGKYVEAFWNIVNWDEAEKRFNSLRKSQH